MMTRITNLEDLFFSVHTTPIFTKFGSEPEIPISNKMAVLHGETNEILGVVSKDYRLVTNREAYAFARECARTVFSNTKEEEWEIFAVDGPQFGDYCHIDLRHKTGKLDFNYALVGTRKEVPDAYGPYIRVTNSYNARRALRFTIGCYRKACKNGMTAPGDLISFSYAHTRNNIRSQIEFNVDHVRVRQMQEEFREAFDVLRRYEFPKEHGKELVKAALAIRKPLNARQTENSGSNAFQRDWLQLEKYIETLYNKYAAELGENAYSVLQAATDLASSSCQNLCLRRDRHSLQRLAGEWMIEFKKECKNQAFDLARYLERPVHTHEKRAASSRALA